MTPRRLAEADRGPLRDFLDRLPEGDRNFFKEDLSEAAVEGWFGAGSAHRAVLTDDAGAIRAYAAIFPQLGWSSHVGEFRLIVDAGSRRQGLGRVMARWGLVEAVQMGLLKLFVELVADQEAAAAMFRDLGFEGEALLTNQVRDRKGELRDLILLAHQVDANAASLASTGLDQL